MIVLVIMTTLSIITANHNATINIDDSPRLLALLQERLVAEAAPAGPGPVLRSRVCTYV